MSATGAVCEMHENNFLRSLTDLKSPALLHRGLVWGYQIRRIYRRGGGISPRGSQIQSRKLYGYDCGYGKRERHRGKAVESRFAFKSTEAKRFCAVFSAARIFFFNTTD